MPKVSIIVPVYNVEPYIEQCMASLVRQTLADIEIICIDDCGADNSMNIVRQYAERDRRVKIVRNAANMGQAAARNTGIREANGKYLGFVDGDDWVEPHMFEKLYLHAETFASDVCWAQFYAVNRKNEILEHVCPIGAFETEFCEKSFNITELSGYGQVVGGLFPETKMTAWLKLVRRDFWRRHNISFQSGTTHDDNIVHFKLLIFAQRLSFVQDRLYYYRVGRKGSVTAKSNFSLASLTGCYDQVIGFFHEQKLYDKYKDYIFEDYIGAHMSAFVRRFPSMTYFRGMRAYLYANGISEKNKAKLLQKDPELIAVFSDFQACWSWFKTRKYIKKLRKLFGKRP